MCPGTTTMSLRQIVSRSQVDVQLDGTKIQMLLLVVVCVETGDLWNKTTGRGRKGVLGAISNPLLSLTVARSLYERILCIRALSSCVFDTDPMVDVGWCEDGPVSGITPAVVPTSDSSAGLCHDLVSSECFECVELASLKSVEVHTSYFAYATHTSCPFLSLCTLIKV